jgi:hypothetical protein
MHKGRNTEGLREAISFKGGLNETNSGPALGPLTATSAGKSL